MQAWRIIANATDGRFPLILVGRKGWMYDELFRTIEELHLQDTVHHIGPVPNNDLVSLYSLAEILVYPSLYEGFGLPVLEAMACGLPVVYPASGGTIELVGDDAGVGVPHPQSWDRDQPPAPEALAEAVRTVLADRDRYAAAARRRAVERFAVEPWLERHAEVFDDALRGVEPRARSSRSG